MNFPKNSRERVLKRRQLVGRRLPYIGLRVPTLGVGNQVNPACLYILYSAATNTLDRKMKSNEQTIEIHPPLSRTQRSYTCVMFRHTMVVLGRTGRLCCLLDSPSRSYRTGHDCVKGHNQTVFFAGVPVCYSDAHFAPRAMHTCIRGHDSPCIVLECTIPKLFISIEL